jgi:hypothetical protein
MVAPAARAALSLLLELADYAGANRIVSSVLSYRRRMAIALQSVEKEAFTTPMHTITL